MKKDLQIRKGGVEFLYMSMIQPDKQEIIKTEKIVRINLIKTASKIVFLYTSSELSEN